MDRVMAARLGAAHQATKVYKMLSYRRETPLEGSL